MNYNYFISAFGTFGNPNGFRQSYWFTNDRSIVNSIKTFDLNTNAIKLFPKSKVYAIRKDYANGGNVIAYSVYSYAKEQNSDRSGTFIGSSILFINQIAEENITINCLNDFHNNLKNKNVQKDTIKVNHSDNLIVSNPKDFDKINFHLREIYNLNFEQNSNKQLVVYCETNPNKLQALFKKAIDLLNVYDTIYFTESKEVAEFVHQKNIFKLVQKDGFETEIQKLAEERKRKIELAVAELKKERESTENARKKTYEDFKTKIEKNEEQHRKNEQIIIESKENLGKINDCYNAFLKMLDELLNQLKSGAKKPDEIKQILNKYKRTFRENISSVKVPDYIDSIPLPKPTTSIRETPEIPQYQRNNNYSYGGKEKKYELDIFKVASLVLLLLWIGTLFFFLFFNKPKKEAVYNKKPQQTTTNHNKPQQTTTKAENIPSESTSLQKTNK